MTGSSQTDGAEFPAGWDQQRIESVLAHYEGQTEAEAADEDARASGAPEPGYTASGGRDYRPREDVFGLFRREADGHLTLLDLFSRRRLAEDVRDQMIEDSGHGSEADYEIERRKIYVGMIS